MGLIYMWISPSGGKYIGQTIQPVMDRWKSHIRESYNLQDARSKTYFHCAIRKYGADNFYLRILEDNIPVEKLDEREIFWIEEYKTYYEDGEHGYNMSRGGKGPVRVTGDSFLEKWNEGKSIAEIHEETGNSKNVIRKRLLSFGIPENELYIRGIKYGNKNSRKKIFQFDLKGRLIKEYLGVHIASIENNFCEECISGSANLNPKLNTYKNFIWSFTDDTEEIQRRIKIKRERHKYLMKPVKCLETNQIFASLTEAAKNFNCSSHTIRRSCDEGKAVLQEKYHFYFIND